MFMTVHKCIIFSCGALMDTVSGQTNKGECEKCYKGISNSQQGQNCTYPADVLMHGGNMGVSNHNTEIIHYNKTI